MNSHHNMCTAFELLISTIVIHPYAITIQWLSTFGVNHLCQNKWGAIKRIPVTANKNVCAWWKVMISSLIIQWYNIDSWSQWLCGLRHQSAAAWLLGLWVGIPPGHGCLSLVSVVSCQADVSAPGWSLVQRSPTECGVSNWVWSWSINNEEALAHQGCYAIGEKKNIELFQNYCLVASCVQ
jgi:hypothetical protein